MTRTTLKIDGMTCGHCVMTVKKTLAGLGVGVENVAIGSAVVTHDPAVTTVDRIIDAVAGAGYPAELDGAVDAELHNTK